MFPARKIFLFIIFGFIAGFFAYKSPYFTKYQYQTGDNGQQPFLATVCEAPDLALVTAVIDGDTIIVDEKWPVRLLYIDAPEKDEPCFAPATSRLKELVLGKEIKLQKDITEMDKHQRCLRVVFIGNENINVQLVQEGLAAASFYEPDVKYRVKVTAAEQYAKENNIGCLWAWQQ